MKNTYILFTPVTVIGTYSSLANAKTAIKKVINDLIKAPAAFKSIIIKPEHPYHFTIRVVPLDDEPITSAEEISHRITNIKASINTKLFIIRRKNYAQHYSILNS